MYKFTFSVNREDVSVHVLDGASNGGCRNYDSRTVPPTGIAVREVEHGFLDAVRLRGDARPL